MKYNLINRILSIIPTRIPPFYLTLLLSLHRCDADPAALSKYVLALIKKDKPLDDLKESMSQQMDVFLQVS